MYWEKCTSRSTGMTYSDEAGQPGGHHGRGSVCTLAGQPSRFAVAKFVERGQLHLSKSEALQILESNRKQIQSRETSFRSWPECTQTAVRLMMQKLFEDATFALKVGNCPTCSTPLPSTFLGVSGDLLLVSSRTIVVSDRHHMYNKTVYGLIDKHLLISPTSIGCVLTVAGSSYVRKRETIYYDPTQLTRWSRLRMDERGRFEISDGSGSSRITGQMSGGAAVWLFAVVVVVVVSITTRIGLVSAGLV